MPKQNKICFPFAKIFVIGLLFCLIGSFEVSAQEEKGKVISSPNQEFDDLIEIENPEISDSESKSLKIKEQKKTFTPQKDIKNDQLYQQRGEKEVKKEGLSTLSFNLFLYVADKFKEKI
jgi:hypothetical protein